MPLKKGNSQKAFEQNYKTEIMRGRPADQALAIAWAMKNKGKGKPKKGSAA
jgi:hypothetical protein